jgi:NTE family protein
MRTAEVALIFLGKSSILCFLTDLRIFVPMRPAGVFQALVVVPLLVITLTPASRAGEWVVSPRYSTKHQSHIAFFTPPEVRRPRVALVLSGGGARGIAQVGVLRALARHHIPVDFIVATSIGAIVGGLYASGYSVSEIESLAVNTAWDDLLSLTEDTRRRELSVDQKILGDRSLIAIRFDGLKPVIPLAVSSGQRLTEYLSTVTLQALYHPYPDYDHLKIPFRAVATDLVSGKRVVMKDGSLAEALRASATVPLLFSPIERDSMRLVDGGLVANIPVDIARERGTDLVLVVNSTSGLRTIGELNAPWQTADQIMSIMMKVVNERELQDADVVITPDIGNHLSSDFHDLHALVRAGEESAEKTIPLIEALLAEKERALFGSDTSGVRLDHPQFRVGGAEVPDTLARLLDDEQRADTLTVSRLQSILGWLSSSFRYRSIDAVIDTTADTTHVTIRLTPFPVVRRVEFSGAHLISGNLLEQPFSRDIGRAFNPDSAELSLEELLSLYRQRGYSLARVDTAVFDTATGTLAATLNEGIIRSIDVQGGTRSRDPFVLGEFPLEPGDVFEIEKAKYGISSIRSTTLFEFVYLEVGYLPSGSALTIRLRERPSQLVRIGLRADNERGLQGLLDVRDENFQGSGMDLGLTVAGGERNFESVVGYKVPRLLGSDLTFGVEGFYRTVDTYLYADGTIGEANHWSRIRVGEYRDIRYGFGLSFGTQLERLGKSTVEFLLQDIESQSLDRADNLEGRYPLSLIRLRSVVDSKDRDPFPTRGVGLSLAYEFAFQAFGSTISYSSLSMMYETYTTWDGRHTFHPRVTMGFADKTMPLPQQFRLGGRESFMGLHEDDERGRQLLLLNVEYRYLLPFKVIVDSYLRLRYDLGTISAVPEEIKFSTLHHGIGVEFALDTPVGEAALGVGKSFYSGSDLSQKLQQGPFLVYAVIGYPF